MYRSVLSPNAGKYGQDKLRIQTLFTQCIIRLELRKRQVASNISNVSIEHILWKIYSRSVDFAYV